MPLYSYGEVEYFKRTNAGKKYVRKLIVDKSTAFNAYQENLNSKGEYIIKSYIQTDTHTQKTLLNPIVSFNWSVWGTEFECGETKMMERRQNQTPQGLKLTN